MIITINNFLDLNVERDIDTDNKYFHDNARMIAGNTVTIEGEESKQRIWEMRTSGLTNEEAQTTVGILANLGDFWAFNGTVYSGKGQRATFETDISSPSSPVFSNGRFTDAIRLNDYDMNLRVYLEPIFMLSFYRQQTEFDDRFYHYFIDTLSDRIWIDGELATDTEIQDHEINDWLSWDTVDNRITFQKDAGDVDEVYVMTGVSYSENLFTAEDIFNAGELPMNGPYHYIEGDFLDSDENMVQAKAIIDRSQWENIGQSNQIRFRLEERI